MGKNKRKHRIRITVSRPNYYTNYGLFIIIRFQMIHQPLS